MKSSFLMRVEIDKKEVEKIIERLHEAIREAQDCLYALDEYPKLILTADTKGDGQHTKEN